MLSDYKNFFHFGTILVMSKALPIAIAIALGGIALTPVIYSVKHPVSPTARTAQLGENATNLQKISYALGYTLAQQTPPEADATALVTGFQDSLDKKQSRYNEEQIKEAFVAYNKEMMDQAQAKQNSSESPAVEGSTEEQKFLTENAKKAGVKTTASGLQYKIVKEGTGKTPTASSNVTVHYEGKTLNGNIFDSSIKRGQPITFPLNQVIPGWTEGLQLLKEGGKMELYIPARLAYGAEEKPGIPANSTLIFDVELIKVQ